MVGQDRRRDAHWVHLTVLLRLVKGSDEVTCQWQVMTSLLLLTKLKVKSTKSKWSEMWIYVYVETCPRTTWLNIFLLRLGRSAAASPIASFRYLWPISLRYSSTAFVASVFSRKIKCSRSMNRSTSHMAMSDRNSWGKITHLLVSVNENGLGAEMISSESDMGPRSPLSSRCFAGCALGQTPPPPCS